MNPINLLTTAIDNLWLWTYGIIAGWGLTVTLMLAALIILLIRTINLQRRVDRLENRIIMNEREFNLFSKTWPGKNTKN
jgi:uncharacterized membrane protein YhiD involved in acid resistance